MKLLSNTLLRLLPVTLMALSTLPAFADRNRIAPTQGITFPEIGSVHPRAAKEIQASSWSIGGETLDRNYADYDKYKSYLGALGAKRIRFQGGWAKTEKQKGVYDWAWLDHMIDDALAQGVQPWLEFSYGNPIYPGGGETGLGGTIPSSPEALAAWDNWVRAMTRRYKDRVSEWAVWNEPDLHNAVPPESYADLFIRTAEIVRAEQPNARLLALSIAVPSNRKYLEGFFKHVKERDKMALVSVLAFHGYPANPDDTGPIKLLREMIATYGPHIELFQSETGCPSTANSFGALSAQPWDETTQAKWDLRRMLAHHGQGVAFNLFTLMELHYIRDGKVVVNTKGKLKSNEDKSVAYAKPSYYAAQNVFSIFDATLIPDADFKHMARTANKLAVYAFRHAMSGKSAVVWWHSGAVPGEANTVEPTDLALRKANLTEPVMVDLRTGKAYAIPAANWAKNDDTHTFRALPLYDSPVLIADKSLLPLREK